MTPELTAPAKRTDKHEPTPAEVLQYMATATRKLVDAAASQYHPLSDFEGRFYGRVRLLDIRREVAAIMAERNEYFTSAYRHEVSPEHTLVCGLMGNTVAMNDLIAGLRAK